jgi:hypothetical protein
MGWDNATITGTLYWLYCIVAIVLMVRVMLKNRDSVKTLAWMMVLLFLPFLGLVLYFFFGRDTRREKLIGRRLLSQIKQRDQLYAGSYAPGEIPQEYSTAIIQENEELFTHKHLATYMWHVDIGAGESRVSYTLEDLARRGLLMDLDYFIIGEVKGPEARYIVTAANTGTTCWCTVHGNDSTEALNKLADYIKSHSDYSSTDIKDIIPFLKSLRVVVFLKNYKVWEISEVVDVDREHGSLIYKPVYNRALPTPWAEDMM